MGIVIITICIAASLVLAGIGLVLRALHGLKRDVAVNRAVLRASLMPPPDPPPLTVLDFESEKNRRRHGMHIVRGGPIALLAALLWSIRRHVWRTAGISSAAAGTLMVVAFALGTPSAPQPPGSPMGGQLPTVGATEPVAVLSTAPTTGVASPSSVVATNSAAADDGGQTVVVVAAARSSTIPAPIPTPSLPVPSPTVSTVRAPILVSSSGSTCSVAATVSKVLGVCVL